MRTSDKIQYITLKGTSVIDGAKSNKLSSPESFEDYLINIIDLTDDKIWENTASGNNSVTCVKDLEIISSMIKNNETKTLVILPQNKMYKFNYARATMYSSFYEFKSSVELRKNLTLLNNIIEKIGNKNDRSWINYNKTKTIIEPFELDSDFVFNDMGEDCKITTAKNGKLITTIKYKKNLYFTTLNFEGNSKAILTYLKYIGWICDGERKPDWIDDVEFLDDKKLIKERQEYSQKMEEIKQNIQKIDESLNVNLFYKSILYKSGDELVSVVNVILNEMIGYDYEKFEDKKEEDFLIEKEDAVFIGEIKGINSNVKRSNITQTSVHRDLYLEIEGNETKNVYAIAIINRQRNTPLSQRDEIHEDIKAVAKLCNVLLIPTETLLSLYEQFKNEEISSEEIKELFKAKGGLFEINI